MKKILSAVILVMLSASLTAQDKKALDAPKELSELSKLKAENLQLKIQNTQCQVNLLDRESKLASFQLSNDQLKLIEEFRFELKAAKDDVFNWQTLTFDKAKKDAEKTIK